MMDGASLRTPSESEQTAPQNIAAEQAILGCILLSNGQYHRVADFLRPEHFSEPVHVRIYAAIEKLIERNEVANPVTLKRFFDADAALAERGGAAYLVKLAGASVTPLNVADYGRTIHEAYKLRQLGEIAENIRADVHAGDPERSADVVIGDAEEALYQLAEQRRGSGTLAPVAEASRIAVARAEEAYKARGKIVGLETGLVDLDRFLGGLMPAELIVCGGRPSMGKTGLATTIARGAARKIAGEMATGGRKGGVGFFSLEMSKEAIAARLIADESGVSTEKQRRGELDQTDFEAIMQGQQAIDRLPIFIDDSAALGIAQIRHRARRMARRNGLSLIIIDHLQKTKQPSKVESRRLEIEEMTGGVAALAKELNVPVLLLSQLSRAVEQRDDRRPTMADLRESGSIEQDADVILFLYREEYYLRRSPPTQRDGEDDADFGARHARWSQRCASVAGAAEIIVAKNRNGRDGTINVHFNAERSRFENAAQEGFLDR